MIGKYNRRFFRTSLVAQLTFFPCLDSLDLIFHFYGIILQFSACCTSKSPIVCIKIFKCLGLSLYWFSKFRLRLSCIWWFWWEGRSENYFKKQLPHYILKDFRNLLFLGRHMGGFSETNKNASVFVCFPNLTWILCVLPTLYRGFFLEKLLRGKEGILEKAGHVPPSLETLVLPFGRAQV